MYAEERHQHIVEQVHVEGRISVTELAADLDVTPETIRRDLTTLDRAGMLHKVHGGAVPASTLALPETGVGDREQVNTAAKHAIAQAAVERLGLAQGGSLLLDAGTTTGALARLIPADLNLTVVTDSVLAAAVLAARGDLTVRVLGGQVRGVTQAAVGPEALETLATMRVDVAVIGANGHTAAHGLSTPDPDEAAVKRAMVRSARRVVALVDATKVGQEHLVSFAPLDVVDLVVTDAPLPPALLTHLAHTGTEVLVA